ncbi:hypothetical protein TEA_014049 [Camellia sinensis var. sinensis]|uniref:Uncharacterized protein n=1 Tax=Camellia sinensis var. sinensis TaxID=542762 RepID=A0A4S4DUY2_CAMSN|nr:hypothetical protein TEA_014049 [Camellia sinensis var. sinensis]
MICFFQLTVHTNALSIQDSSALKQVGQNDSCLTPRDEVQNGAFCQGETVSFTSKVVKDYLKLSHNVMVNGSRVLVLILKLQDDLQMIGLKIKEHEDNVKNMKAQKNSLDDSILDMQVNLGKYHSSSMPMMEDEDHTGVDSEEEPLEHIIGHEKSAAGILCLLKTRHGNEASNLLLTKDVLGIVATLGKVDDDNLSSSDVKMVCYLYWLMDGRLPTAFRLLSEYLGIETMLAVVCKTYDGVKALETYENDGSVSKSSGLHGLGTSIGRHLDGRFQVICLENLRRFHGEFVAEDPQMQLDLFKPRLPNGETPRGFLGFAVNMVNIDNFNLFCVTADGHGLRETLFYNLFSHLQVYSSRADMLQALPCISDGAISLDGGIIKTTGMFSLGDRILRIVAIHVIFFQPLADVQSAFGLEGIDVKFPKSHGASKQPANYFETEKRIKEMQWKKERVLEDTQREQALLDNMRINFEMKKQEFVKYLAESAVYATQGHIHLLPKTTSCSKYYSGSGWERQIDSEMIFALKNEPNEELLLQPLVLPWQGLAQASVVLCSCG